MSLQYLRIANRHSTRRVLQVNITERPIRSTHNIFHTQSSFPSIPQVKRRLQRGIRTRRRVQKRARSSNPISAKRSLRVQVLPDPPNAVDHRMVQIEGRVAGRDVEVSPWIAAERVVAASVDADVAGAGNALHDCLEVADVVVVEDRGDDGGRVGVLAVDRVGQVALETAWVVREAVACNEGAVDQGEKNGAEVHAHCAG